MTATSTPGGAALSVLFTEPPELDLAAIAKHLASLATPLEEAVIEMIPGSPIASVRFGEHAILVRAVGEPLPEPIVEPCVQLAHYDADRKEVARRHRCFVACEHEPSKLSALAQIRAVALVAGAVAHLGGDVIVNVAAKTSVPAELLMKSTDDMIAFVEALPPLLLFMGFGKYAVAGREGIWMRTHGGPALGIPDLARLAASHAEGQATFATFNDMIVYLLDSRAPMADGDVAQLGQGRFVRFRAPSPIEGFLEGEGPILVVEEVAMNEVSGPDGDR